MALRIGSRVSPSAVWEDPAPPKRGYTRTSWKTCNARCSLSAGRGGGGLNARQGRHAWTREGANTPRLVVRRESGRTTGLCTRRRARGENPIAICMSFVIKNLTMPSLFVTTRSNQRFEIYEVPWVRPFGKLDLRVRLVQKRRVIISLGCWTE